MKILCVSDNESHVLWDHWSEAAADRLADISLILSAGDLKSEYLEFLVTMLSVPLVYVRGNHDDGLAKTPPGGCICAEDKLITLRIPDHSGAGAPHAGTGSGMLPAVSVSTDCSESSGTADPEGGAEAAERIVRIAGLGGSMKYRDGLNMYTESEMTRRVRKMRIRIRLSDLRLRVRTLGSGTKGTAERNKAAGSGRGTEPTDILLTHAPCRGYGDLEDLAHMGFGSLERLVADWAPELHVYGHVHRSYGMIGPAPDHPSGTRMINADGYIVIEI